MSVNLVRILMPLGAASKIPSLTPVFAFDLGDDRYRVLGRQPGCELWRWAPDSVVLCENTDAGVIAISPAPQ